MTEAPMSTVTNPVLLQALFWISAAFIIYTYLGYPLLLRALARRAQRREGFTHRHSNVRSDGALDEPEVVIVIVAYNEAARIQSKIDSCLAQDYPPARLRVLIVSDGSTDEMVNIIRTLGDPRVAVLPFTHRRGKAACLNDAVASVNEPVIVMNDARQMLHPQAVRNLAKHFCDPQVGAVSGELIFRLDDATAFGEGVDAYWRYEKAIRRLEGRIDSVVGVTGAIYALRRSLYQPIPPETVLDDVLIPMNVVMQGSRVLFESDAIAYDRPSQDVASEKRRKIRTLAGNFQLITSHPKVLDPRANRIFLQFISHKTARLIAPFAMMAALISCAMLAPGNALYLLLLLAQVVIYTMPFIGQLSPAVARTLPVRVVSAFVVLNWFVVLGLYEFLTNRNVHVWRTR